MMTRTDVKKRWLDTYELLSNQASAFRDSQSVSFGLLDAYDKLSMSEKECVHEILGDWFVSEDNRLRYDAGFLTSERHIVDMKPAINRAIEQAERRSGPEATHEVRKLKRILAELS